MSKKKDEPPSHSLQRGMKNTSHWPCNSSRGNFRNNIGFNQEHMFKKEMSGYAGSFFNPPYKNYEQQSYRDNRYSPWRGGRYDKHKARMRDSYLSLSERESRARKESSSANNNQQHFGAHESRATTPSPVTPSYFISPQTTLNENPSDDKDYRELYTSESTNTGSFSNQADFNQFIGHDIKLSNSAAIQQEAANSTTYGPSGKEPSKLCGLRITSTLENNSNPSYMPLKKLGNFPSLAATDWFVESGATLSNYSEDSPILDQLRMRYAAQKPRVSRWDLPADSRKTCDSFSKTPRSAIKKNQEDKKPPNSHISSSKNNNNYIPKAKLETVPVNGEMKSERKNTPKHVSLFKDFQRQNRRLLKSIVTEEMDTDLSMPDVPELRIVEDPECDDD